MSTCTVIRGSTQRISQTTFNSRHVERGRASRVAVVETPRQVSPQVRLPVVIGRVKDGTGGAVGQGDDAGSTERAAAVSDLVRQAAGRMRSADAERPPTKFASFPSGSLRWSGAEEFLAIGRSHGGGWDVDHHHRLSSEVV